MRTVLQVEVFAPIPPQNTNDTEFPFPTQNTNNTDFTFPTQNTNNTDFTVPSDRNDTLQPILRHDVTLQPLQELPPLTEEQRKELSESVERNDIAYPPPSLTNEDIQGPPPDSETAAKEEDIPIVSNPQFGFSENSANFGAASPPKTANIRVFFDKFIGHHASVIAEPYVANDGKRIWYTAS